jgi:hypothetical protein
MSYPAVVVHAGVVVDAGLTRTPLVPAALLLQLGEVPAGEFAAHGTELFPLVTSLNAQVEPERTSVEELQLWPAVAAILYNTGLALPWRPACDWLIKAMIPAKAGEEAEVPPDPKKLKCPLESGAHDGALPAGNGKSAWHSR